MAKKASEQNTRKLYKVGRSATYCVTLPIEIIREFGWREKQKLMVEADKKKKRIIIKDWE